MLAPFVASVPSTHGDLPPAAPSVEANISQITAWLTSNSQTRTIVIAGVCTTGVMALMLLVYRRRRARAGKDVRRDTPRSTRDLSFTSPGALRFSSPRKSATSLASLDSQREEAVSLREEEEAEQKASSVEPRPRASRSMERTSSTLSTGTRRARVQPIRTLAMERVAVGDTTPGEAEVLDQRMDSMDERVEIQRMEMQRMEEQMMEEQMRQTTFNMTRAQMTGYL